MMVKQESVRERGGKGGRRSRRSRRRRKAAQGIWQEKRRRM
jgi:hypothetical protein